ncbi:MAG: hypothetical protein QGH82_03385, partial [Candidatus Woesearchaeota archaeon]|nr:hypothetical protein [Candidatus Woesearchaeota archaeon]
ILPLLRLILWWQLSWLSLQYQWGQENRLGHFKTLGFVKVRTLGFVKFITLDFVSVYRSFDA